MEILMSIALPFLVLMIIGTGFMYIPAMMDSSYFFVVLNKLIQPSPPF